MHYYREIHMKILEAVTIPIVPGKPPGVMENSLNRKY